MTHKRLLVAVVLLAASGVVAQTANVIELSPVDAARAQKAWDTLQKAQTEWQSVRSDVEKNYVKRSCLVIGCTATPVEGFDGGFEFSKDFKVIVPKPSTWTTTTGTITTIPGSPTYPCWANPPCTNCFRYQ